MAEEIKNCVECGEEIPKQAAKCKSCHCYQSFKRHLAVGVPALSLLVAVVAVTPQAVDALRDYFDEPGPEFETLSFFADNISDSNGELVEPLDFRIGVQILNLGDTRIIIDDSLMCTVRDEISEKSDTPEMSKEIEDELEVIIVSLTFGFEIYFENKQKAVVEPGETKTVYWGVSTGESVEYFGPEYDAYKYGPATIDDFYNRLVRDFLPFAEDYDSYVFPSWYDASERVLTSFALNVDCTFTLSDRTGETEEELHLEFLYEKNGSSGTYPRWSLGKNIGGGFGNGAGGPGSSNGAG